VAELKETDGGPVIVHGSATLNRNLSDAGLIDRYHLLVFPVLLGAGKRLFSATDKDKQGLELVESESYGNGIQKLVYDVTR
jgi:dihydrofolate reductase